MLELYTKAIGIIMLSETLLICTVKELIAELVSRINECDYCLTYYKSFMVDVGLTSHYAIAADYQTATILDADKKILAYVEKVTRHAYKTTDTDVEGLKGCGWSEEQVLEEKLYVGLFSNINRWGSVTKMIELVAS